MTVSIVGNKMKTRAPLEPALVISAPVAFNAKEGRYRQAFGCLLSELINNGTVLDRGPQGDLYTRLLFILPRDRATIKKHKEFMQANRTHLHSITLADFLYTLTGPDGDCSDLDLTKPLDEIPISLLERAFLVGAALQCSLDKQHDPKYMGIIGGQIKTKAQSASQNLGARIPFPHITFSQVNAQPGVSKKRKLLIFMDPYSPASFKTGDKVEMTRRQATNPCDDKEPNNFLLNIRGRGLQQYPVIKGFEQEFHTLFDHRLPASLPRIYQEMEMEIEMDPLEFPAEET
ncbi:hypothetical protein FRB96_007326 [Tulasnella sp. 330]|nr:hypothetical protein FRB96_007326 [Tulasnella sp. 330]